MIRWWLHLQRLKWRERRLLWELSQFPDENLYPVLEYVRYARRAAEAARPMTYPLPQDGSR